MGKQHGKVNVRNRKPPQEPPQAHQSLCTSRQVPTELLQLVLNMFSNTFSSQLDSGLSERIQQVKQFLYNRDFDNAFGEKRLLEAYAARWSPSRALAYTKIFYNLPVFSAILSPILFNGPEEPGVQDRFDSTIQGPHIMAKESLDSPQMLDRPQRRLSRIVFIGAGAGAEIVALGAFLRYLEDRVSDEQNPEGASAMKSSAKRLQFDVKAIDIADWGLVVSRLHSAITTAPPLSPYASAEAKAANRPLADPSMYRLQFVREDVLEMKPADLATSLAEANFVTLMFTLNELYSTSITATTNLLLSLTTIMSPDALLLVVDSPGSYSTVKLGATSDRSDEKIYPMQWLLDHTLLKSAATGSGKDSSFGRDQWEKLEARESEWFRLPKGLTYPIELEDMRYQLHLYRRL